MTSKLGTALITGASIGIGAIYADRLAKRGYDLILVARNVDKLNALADKLGTAYGRKVTALEADLGSREGVAKVEKVLREDPSITTLVNNAGIGGAISILDSDVDKMSEMVSLNVDALMRLTVAVVPGFVKRGDCTIINIASAIAIAPEVLNGVYGGTKAFVLAFSQNLKAQLSDKGVRVQVVMPGATATDFWGTSGTPLEYLPKEIVMPAEEMVDAALVGLDRGEFATIPALVEVKDWDAFEGARQNLMQKMSLQASAPRYGVSAKA